MPYDFNLSSATLANGRTAHHATLAGSGQARFLIGYKTYYEGNTGLFNTDVTQGNVYRPEDYEEQNGFWAWFIYPTAMAESGGSFSCLNTYDRAKFTFGFMQYAAHVPDGDFVKFLKALLKLPEARQYFPRLLLKGNNIWYDNDLGNTYQLEDNQSTRQLMDYLNPALSEIEHQELICSARMVHWATNDPLHRQAQVETAIELFRNNIASYSRRFGLNGAPARVCHLICDIRHQGRARNDDIAAAISTGGNWDKAYSNLLLIGLPKYKSRIDTIRNTTGKLLNGKFNMKYDEQNSTFIRE